MIIDEIKITIKTKWIGCFVALAAWLLTFIHMITYSQIGKIDEGLFSAGVIVSCVIGLIAFAALSLFRKTSQLAPAALMICDLMCLMFFVGAENFQDYFSTQFFDGFSMGKLFSLGAPVWFSMFSFIISFIVASVAMYLPQNRKTKPENDDKELAEGKV